MNIAADRRVFNKLPETVIAYRGCHHVSAINGYSWTLTRSVAEDFAHRGGTLVATASIPREWIIAYSNDREEQEIIVNRLLFNDDCITSIDLVVPPD